jgi:hypothetical protein
MTMILRDDGMYSASVPGEVTASNYVISNQEQYCANHGHKEAIDIQARHAGSSESVEEKAADHSADNPQDNVENNAFAGLVYEFAANEAGYQAEDDPREN